MIEWLDTLIQGTLLGGLYALFAVGLSITYGVMRIVNIAHGDFIVLASYITLPVVGLFGMHPFLAMPIVVVVLAVIGYLLQTSLLNRTLGSDLLAPLLVTFGLSIVIQNGLLQFFSADSRAIQIGELQIASLQLGAGLAIGWFPLIVFLVALMLTAAMAALFSHTRLGMSLRATSDDPNTAGLMGIRAKHVYAVALSLAFALVAVGGVFSGIRTTFTPSTGPVSLLYAFEAVVIGGLGSLWGTFVGAVILGIAQAVGSKLDSGYGILAGHAVFLLVLVFRPQGLLPRTRG
jgi:branched-chain amino acid transport system permease protein